MSASMRAGKPAATARRVVGRIRLRRSTRATSSGRSRSSAGQRSTIPDGSPRTMASVSRIWSEASRPWSGQDSTASARTCVPSADGDVGERVASDGVPSERDPTPRGSSRAARLVASSGQAARPVASVGDGPAPLEGGAAPLVAVGGTLRIERASAARGCRSSWARVG